MRDGDTPGLRDEVEELFSVYQAGPDFDEMEEGYGLAGQVKDKNISTGEQWLRARGEHSFIDDGDQLFRASHVFKNKESERVMAYYKTPAGIAARARAYEKLKAKRASARMQPAEVVECRDEAAE